MSLTQFDTFFPFDQGQGLNASQPRWRQMGRLFHNSGVLNGYQSQFSTTLASGTLTIQPGGAWIDGFYGETIASKTMTASNGTLVVRMDPTGRQIGFVIITGALTQSLTANWEIPLYTISGTTLTDIRQYANPVVPVGGLAYTATAPNAAANVVNSTANMLVWSLPLIAGAKYQCNMRVYFTVTGLPLYVNYQLASSSPVLANGVTNITWCSLIQGALGGGSTGAGSTIISSATAITASLWISCTSSGAGVSANNAGHNVEVIITRVQ